MKLILLLVTLFIGSCFSGISQAQTFTVQKFSIGGKGGTDYLTAEPGTGRVFCVKRVHMLWYLDGNTGKILGVITDTPNNHGIALAKKSNHGFITNRGDSTVTMFDLTTLATIKKIKIPAGGQDSRSCMMILLTASF